MTSGAPEPNAESAAGLRQMVLSLQPQELGVDPGTLPHGVWGILLETGSERGAYTLVVLADGTTSLYFSTGGGIIGAGAHETVRSAAAVFLRVASRYASDARPSSAPPLPQAGDTAFHFLTADGLRSYLAREADLGEGRDYLSSLFHAGHAVISELRQLDL